MEKKFKDIVLTGDRPTGRLHLGHFVGSLQNRVKLQDEYDEVYYMVADVQALTDNADNPEKVRDNLYEVILDNLAVGVDPTKTTMFVQSQIPEIAELTIFFLNLITAQQLSHNPTIKTEAAQKGYKLATKFDGDTEVVDDGQHGIPMGFLGYPVSQAADILFAKANIIPVGDDQLPILEVVNDVVRKFNGLYGEVFSKVKPMLSETTRLVGTDGNAKASKSLGNAIFLADEPAVINKKVNSMFTCPSKVQITDTVTADELAGNVVFQYLDIFDERTDEMAELKQKYMAGDPDTGDGAVKARLVEVLEGILAPIRERRAEFASDMDAVQKIVQEGNAKAREVAARTMIEVRKAMKIDYFV